MKSIKVVIVGDSGVGKTSLLMKYMGCDMPTESTQSFISYPVNKMIYDKQITLNLYDTNGDKDHDMIRPEAYTYSKIADVVLICYSIDSIDSYNNVSEKWIQEVKKHCTNVPIILVGIKYELDSNYNIMVQQDTGRKLVNKHELYNFQECSINTEEGVDHIFDNACKVVFDKRNPQVLTASELLPSVDLVDLDSTVWGNIIGFF